ILKDNINFGYVGCTRQLVGLEVWIQDYSGLTIQDSFFIKGEADAHDDPTICLAHAGKSIDEQTAVLHTHNAFYSDKTGFGINFNLCHLNAADTPSRESFFPAAASDHRLYSQACDG